MYRDNKRIAIIVIIIFIIAILFAIIGLVSPFESSTDRAINDLRQENEKADQLIFEMEHQDDIKHIKAKREYRRRMLKALEDE